MKPSAPPAPNPEQPDWYFGNSLLVYTAAHHLNRGQGGRHCPYEPRHVEGNQVVQSVYRRALS